MRRLMRIALVTVLLIVSIVWLIPKPTGTILTPPFPDVASSTTDTPVSVPSTPPGSMIKTVPWSQLGIVADGKTDNTAALNKLPNDGTIVYCDTGAENIVVFGSQKTPWYLKSNVNLALNNCHMQCFYTSQGETGCITQVDKKKPLTNVSISGLNVTKPSLSYDGIMLYAWIDHLTLKNFSIGTHNGAIILRGSDQDVGPCTISNSNHAPGNPGIRFVGNIPKVPTTLGRPANVWVHNCTVESGDSAFIVRSSPSSQTNGSWPDVSADDYLFENSVGLSWGGDGLLAGVTCANDSQKCLYNHVNVSNITFRNMRVSAGARQLRVENRYNSNGGLVSDIRFENISIDASLNSGTGSSMIIRGFDSHNPVRRVTAINVNVQNPYARALDIVGNVEDVTFDKSTFGIPRAENLSNIRLLDGVRTTISNSTIASRGDGISVGTAVAGISHPTRAPILLENTIAGIGNTYAGIVLAAVDAANVTRNKIFSSAANAYGIVLTGMDTKAGTTNSIIKGNDVSGILKESSRIVCVSSHGNTVMENLGVADCAQ